MSHLLVVRRLWPGRLLAWVLDSGPPRQPRVPHNRLRRRLGSEQATRPPWQLHQTSNIASSHSCILVSTGSEQACTVQQLLLTLKFLSPRGLSWYNKVPASKPAAPAGKDSRDPVSSICNPAAQMNACWQEQKCLKGMPCKPEHAMQCGLSQ